jgi:hypothetical protein
LKISSYKILIFLNIIFLYMQIKNLNFQKSKFQIRQKGGGLDFSKPPYLLRLHPIIADAPICTVPNVMHLSILDTYDMMRTNFSDARSLENLTEFRTSIPRVVGLARLGHFNPALLRHVPFNALFVVDSIASFTAHLCHFHHGLFPTLIQRRTYSAESTVASNTVTGIRVVEVESFRVGVLLHSRSHCVLLPFLSVGICCCCLSTLSFYHIFA